MSTSCEPRQASFSGKLPPRKPKNHEVRPREYLTEDEVGRLIQAARRQGRHGHRDATLILITYRHGLRVSEAISLQWNAIDLDLGAQEHSTHGSLHATIITSVSRFLEGLKVGKKQRHGAICSC